MQHTFDLGIISDVGTLEGCQENRITLLNCLMYFFK